MGMVVRTNTMALNAYRQLGMNNSAVSKSLEKLSSGFRINRAGDDAAGLAISEKMKAQITGLETASANAQDGISLIQTAEGNLSEVHDMLNRMVELASKSANGTYTSTERQALQDEVDQLLSEIDRISQSANFNGTKLLDGSLDGEETKVVGAPTFTDLKAFADKTAGTAGPGYGTRFSGTANAPWEYEDTEGVTTHKNAAGSGKSAFEVRLQNREYTFKDGVNSTEFAFNLGVGDNTDDSATVDNEYKFNVSANADGKVSIQDVSKAFYDSLAGDDYKIEVNVGAKDADGNDIGAVEYAVSRKEDGTLAFEMTEAGQKTAAKATNLEAFRVNMVASFSATTADDIDNASSKTDMNTAATVIGNPNSNGRLAETFVGFDAAQIKDGAGMKVGDEYYVWAGTDETLNGEYGDNVKVVDIRDLVNDQGALDTTKTNGILRTTMNEALTRMVKAAEGNKMFSVQLGRNGDSIGFTERADNTSDADLTTAEGVKAQIQGFAGINANVKTTPATGKALTLQIGDTADSFNKMSVNVADMSTKGLGLNKLSIMTEADASNAIDTVKTAINTVSSARAGMGALQNRLEHTINNLDVAVENLSAANSRIRDTDMAKEMMNYTKMNVLVQSAQAMLAQANQQPQSVLQLLQ